MKLLNKEYREKNNNIYNHYGAEHQELKVVEEMAELTHGIMRMHNSDPAMEEEYFKNTKEEMADVLVLLLQLIDSYDCKDEIKEIMKYKIDRELNRIEGTKILELAASGIIPTIEDTESEEE